MGTLINVQPISRIEGHARVAIQLDDAGNVADAKFHVMALRGFEEGDARLLREVLELPPETGESELRSLVAATAPQLEPWVPLIGVPLGIDIDETPQVKRLAPKFRTARMHDSIVQLITPAHDSMVGLIVEDAQHIDEASHALLEHIATSMAGRAAAVIVRRPTDVEFDAESALHIPLEPLDDDAAAELVNAVRHDRPLLQHQVRSIVERGQGASQHFLR